MKVLALNGSPRRRTGATSRLLEALLAGMAEAGAATELVQLADLELRSCLGCYTCWVATPGECVFRDRDGMARVVRAWRDADLVVFGTPLYHFSMTGLMKNFLDRLLPESEPWLVEDPQAPGRTMHPRRFRQPASALLVSPCGFPDADQFAPLVHTFRYIAGRHHWTWLGELLRPGAEVLTRAAAAPVAEPYLAEVRRAGAALVVEGRIPPDLQEALGRELVPGGRQDFFARANQHWEALLGRSGPPASAGITPRAAPDARGEGAALARGDMR